MRNGLLKILSLFLLAGAIALSPSFPVGTLSSGKVIEIRVEDILIAVLGLIWIVEFFLSSKKKIEKPPLFLPVLAWLGIGFISVLTNWIFGTLGFERGFFYFLKEVEFFVFYFYVFYQTAEFSLVKKIVNIWFLLAGINFLYVFYQLIVGAPPGKYGEYAIGAICEWGVFPSGCFFLLLFIFLSNIFLYYFRNLNISNFKKGLLYFIGASPLIGAVGSGSKTVFLAVILSLFLTSVLLLRIKPDKKSLFWIFILFVTAFVFIFSVYVRAPAVHRRVNALLNFQTLSNDIKSDRLVFIDDSLKRVLEREDLSSAMIGFGAGYMGEVHNQYLRNFIETGIIGSILFLILISVIIKKSWDGITKRKDDLSIGLSSGLLIATLAMLFCGLTTSPFFVVKPAEVYWFFTALTMAVFVINKRD